MDTVWFFGVLFLNLHRNRTLFSLGLLLSHKQYLSEYSVELSPWIMSFLVWKTLTIPRPLWAPNIVSSNPSGSYSHNLGLFPHKYVLISTQLNTQGEMCANFWSFLLDVLVSSLCCLTESSFLGLFRLLILSSWKDCLYFQLHNIFSFKPLPIWLHTLNFLWSHKWSLLC